MPRQPHMASLEAAMHDKILIVDFGSQVTQLIARRVREEKVYCEVVPFQKAEAALRGDEAEGGDPLRRPGFGARPGRAAGPHGGLRGRRAGARHLLRRAGDGLAARRHGRGGHHREFGRAEVEVGEDTALFDGVWQKGEKYPVWMSHGDRVTKLPQGFRAVATSPNAPIAVIADEKRKFYADAISSRSRAHAARRGALAQFRTQDRGRQGRLDDARLQGRGDREDQEAGRQGQGDLRPVRRRRFGGRGGADPRGDRRAAHLRVRRPRPAASWRSRAGRDAVPRQLQYPAGARRRREDVSRCARQA